jgi:Mg-chelatase subunit ChlD
MSPHGRWYFVLPFLVSVALIAGGSPATARAASPLKVVQLGDSYSAGNGAGDYYGPKDCYRSTSSYARLWVSSLKTAHNVTFINRACSGGVLDNLDHRRSMGETDVNVYVPSTVEKDDPGARRQAEQSGRCASPYRDDESFELSPYAAVPQLGGTVVYFKCKRYMNPQWDVVDKSADIVLMTVGGNDVRFADIVAECFVVGIRDPHECKDKVDEANRDMPGLAQRIEDFLKRLKARMRPDAKILLLSYPFLEKDENLTLGTEVFGIGTRYDVGRQVRAVGRAGDEMQRGAVNAVNAEDGARVTFIDDIKTLFAGHEPDGRVCCQNDSRWLHEPTDSTIRYEWYHFNRSGHDAIGGLLGGFGDFGAGHSATSTAAGIDVVFAIDTTGSMGNSINAVKQTATQLINDVSAQTTSARFALIDFRDYASRTGSPGDYPAKLDADFTTQGATVAAAIQDLSLGYGGDTPETMFSALHMAYGLTWRAGVKKLVVVLSDAPPLSPEPISGLTANQVLQESLAIDPVELHLVDVGSATTTELTDIAQQTNGGVYDSSSSGAAQQISDAIDRSIDQPYAWVQGPYVGKVGDTKTLDGSGSYGIGSEIVSYEWDLDGDGNTDVTSATPTLEHTFDAAIDALVTLRVTDGQGRTGLATTPVRISDDGDEVARDVDNCPDVANPGQEDEDGDAVGDVCDPTPGFPTKDLPGVYEITTAAAAPTPSPSAPAPSAPRPTTPKAKMKAKANVKLSKLRLSANGRRLTVRVRCTTKARCTGRLAAKLGRTTFRVSYRVKGGKTATVALTLPRKARTSLSRRPQKVTVTATTSAGARTVHTVRLARHTLRG